MKISLCWGCRVVALRRGMGIGWGVVPSSWIRRLGHGPNLSKCSSILTPERGQNGRALRFIWCRYLPRTPTNTARTPPHPTPMPAAKIVSISFDHHPNILMTTKKRHPDSSGWRSYILIFCRSKLGNAEQLIRSTFHATPFLPGFLGMTARQSPALGYRVAHQKCIGPFLM